MGGPLPVHAEVVVPPMEGMQVPCTHPLFAAQGMLQPPQFALSFWVSTHAPSHATVPGRQLDAHAPPEQTMPPWQVTPQPPQFIGSWLVGMQTPLQSAW